MDFHRIFHLLEGFHCDLLEGAVHPKDLTIRVRDRVGQLQGRQKLFLAPAVC